MKILTLCQWGLVRSVALRRILIDELGADVIAAGLEVNTPKTLAMLGEWADHIILATGSLLKLPTIAALPRDKLCTLSLGPDKWQTPAHPDLKSACWQQLAPVISCLRRGGSPRVV